MKFLKNLLRLRKILFVCRKYRLTEHLPKSLRTYRFLLILVTPFTIPCPKNLNSGERLRLALTSLGPIFIKFGQLLSTRRDLLPEEIANALAQLQDQVEPFCGNKAREITESALTQPIESIFSNFETTPLASASVAQVHSATLLSGEEVVLKVIRPGIQDTIDADLALMSGIAAWLEENIKASHRFKPVEVVSDYQGTIYNELDLRREAANTMKLRQNWLDSHLLYVPEVYWDYCHNDILVMEKIHGIPVSDIDALKSAGTNMKVLSERGVEIFFTQVFRDSFFHADMHPGNIFVDVTNPEEPQYIAIDCGIMGALTKEDQRYLAENFLAFFNRDYRMIAKLHIESGWIDATTPEAEFETAIRTVCEPIFGKPLSEISFGHFLISLFQTARRFNMPVQPQLVLLQKTLLYIEGLGRQLYPKLDLWQTAKPYLENWLKDRISPSRFFEALKKQAPFWGEKLPEIPDLLYKALKSDAKKQFYLEQQTSLLAQQLNEQKISHNKTIYAIAGMTSILSGVLINLLSGTDTYIDTVLIVTGIGLFLNSYR
ncbi:MAG: ubiquinone biosynthesis regulatory protein kinase UbiB [Gammaproteobacteria bacterium]|nr:ubiquinone biosynthesis regulatory protein kinase UbiB [Gammaproteobacteria bacterium]